MAGGFEKDYLMRKGPMNLDAGQTPPTETDAERKRRFARPP